MALSSTSATAMSAWPDEALLASTRAGDERAFGELYQRHVAAARAAARCLVSAADVDDVVADAFANIFSIIRRGGGPEVAFRPYLLVCVRNTCYRLSSRRPVPVDPLEAALDGPSSEADPLSAVVESSVVAKAFFSLPERWQQVLWQTEVEGRRPSELSDELGLSAGAVAALSFRAREGLSLAYLEAYLPERRPGTSCTAVVALMAPYVRNRLSDAERDVVGAHLEQCAPCASTLDDLEAANRPLRSLLGPAILGVSGSAYVARLVGGAARTVRRLATAKALGAAAAAAVAIGVGTIAHPPTGIPSAPAAAAAENSVAPPTGTVPWRSSRSARPTSLDPPGPPSGSDGATEGPAPAGDLRAPSDAPAAAADGTSPGGASGASDTVSVPGVTVPTVPTTLPEVTVPGLTIPAISTPEVDLNQTVPGVSLAPITVPSITTPEITVPATTLPAVTVPPITVPPVAVQATTPTTTSGPLGGDGGVTLDVNLGAIGVHVGLSPTTTTDAKTG